MENARRTVSPGWLAGGFVALLVVGLLGYGLLGRPTSSLKAGSPVPAFQITAFDGSNLSPDMYRGKVLVINFFASWCPPCREEAPALEQAWRNYQSKGVQFIGIAYKDAAPKAQAFLAEFGLTYPNAADPSNRIARDYGVTGVPETFVIDQQGNLVRHFPGSVTREQLSREIDRLLSP